MHIAIASCYSYLHVKFVHYLILYLHVAQLPAWILLRQKHKGILSGPSFAVVARARI